MPTPDPMVSMRCGKKTRAGGTCGRWAMRGQRVCHMHGGKSPQALAKADERLRSLELPAIEIIGWLMRHADSDAVRFATARWLLEVLGHKATDKVQTDGRTVLEVEYVERPLALTERVG